MKQVTEQEALSKLTLMCSQAEHCQQEMLDKMDKWGIEAEAQARIMEYLVSEKYIDEARYCRGYIHDKMEYNRWGRRKIEQGLWMKRISREVSAPLFDEIDDDVWCELLQPLIEQKRRSTKGRNDYEIKQKLLRFAMGRGFSMDQAIRCVGELD